MVRFKRSANRAARSAITNLFGITKIDDGLISNLIEQGPRLDLSVASPKKRTLPRDSTADSVHLGDPINLGHPYRSPCQVPATASTANLQINDRKLRRFGSVSHFRTYANDRRCSLNSMAIPTRSGCEQLFEIDCNLSEGLRKRLGPSLFKDIETRAICRVSDTCIVSSESPGRFDDSPWSRSSPRN